MIWEITCACVLPVASYCGSPVWVLRALLIAVAAPARSLFLASASAMISCASAYFAIGIVDASDEYLFTVQIGVLCDVPTLPLFVTSVRGSGVPLGVSSTVRFRNDGS